MYKTSPSRYEIALVCIDDTPLWVEAHAIQALSPDPETGKTTIVLTSGAKVTTPTLADDVIELISKAFQPGENQ